ncbi:hypothetical protein [Stenotrophomonas maltophilia]|uniref:hypothetical protein n=1 Tax=Stenotrophomonas maltophilia TaxID=40324 RepID=UPI0012AF2FB0|nr:hypothetical protein [Stenotrophomonas maltophilia]QGM06084.1 hypothetical protein FEO88_14935 [Stenotrophomonas maltophilia]
MDLVKWTIIRCWPLGQECAVDWSAWAVGTSVLAVVATLFLGFMTLKLGRAANEASAEAFRLSKKHLERQEERDHNEKLILLLRLTGEVADACEILTKVQKFFSTEEGRNHFLTSQMSRDVVVANWKKIAFPNFEACRDRLHYLPIDVAARMARVVGILTSFANANAGSPAPRQAQARKSLEGMEFISRVVLVDLKVVSDACAEAVEELGLVDEAIADESDRLTEKVEYRFPMAHGEDDPGTSF